MNNNISSSSSETYRLLADNVQVEQVILPENSLMVDSLMQTV